MGEKVKYHREIKRFSQERVAFELGLNPYQYSRRENGSIKFDADELSQLSAIFHMGVSEFFGDEMINLNLTHQSGQYRHILEEIFRQYEHRLKEKDELIQFLKDCVVFFRKTEVV